jgi:hypothetical protein
MRVFKLFAALAVLAVSSQAFGQFTTGDSVVYDPSTGILEWVNNYPATSTPVLQTLSVYMAGGLGAPNGAQTSTIASNAGGWLPTNNWAYTAFPDPDVGEGTPGSEMDFSSNNFPNTVALPSGTYYLATLGTGLTAADFGNDSQTGGPGNPLGTVSILGADGETENQSVDIVSVSVPEPTAVVGMFGASIIGLAGFFGRRLRKSAV